MVYRAVLKAIRKVKVRRIVESAFGQHLFELRTRMLKDTPFTTISGRIVKVFRIGIVLDVEVVVVRGIQTIWTSEISILERIQAPLRRVDLRNSTAYILHTVSPGRTFATKLAPVTTHINTSPFKDINPSVPLQLATLPAIGWKPLKSTASRSEKSTIHLAGAMGDGLVPLPAVDGRFRFDEDEDAMLLYGRFAA